MRQPFIFWYLTACPVLDTVVPLTDVHNIKNLPLSMNMKQAFFSGTSRVSRKGSKMTLKTLMVFMKSFFVFFSDYQPCGIHLCDVLWYIFPGDDNSRMDRFRRHDWILGNRNLATFLPPPHHRKVPCYPLDDDWNGLLYFMVLFLPNLFDWPSGEMFKIRKFVSFWSGLILRICRHGNLWIWRIFEI